MTDQPTHSGGGAPTAHADDAGANRAPERIAFRVLVTLAVVVTAVALLLSLLPRGCADAVREVVDDRPGVPGFLGDLDTQPQDLLPSSVTMYETVTRQQVPGMPHVAEAIYLTYDMAIQVHRPTTSYARVEAFASQQEAASRIDELMAEYPVDQRRVALGTVTPATTGYAPDEGAWMAAWTRGQFLVRVRVFFDGPVPVDKGTILHDQGMHIARAVDLYQRTGSQGVGALETLQQEGDVFVPDPESDLGPLPEVEE